MREFKFRAWDKFATTPQMVFFDLDILQEGKTLLADSVVDADVMQYTGLKDKNGVGIYEGDWVKTSYHTNKVFHYGLVDWVDYGFGIRRRDTTTSNKLQVFGVAPLPDSSRIEVIGNIYENPELLEANQ